VGRCRRQYVPTVTGAQIDGDPGVLSDQFPKLVETHAPDVLADNRTHDF
jgi:hypothetical protein